MNHQPITGRPPPESRDQPDFIRRLGSSTRPSSPSKTFITSLPFHHRRDRRQDTAHPRPTSHPRNRRLIRPPVRTSRRLRIDAPSPQDDIAKRTRPQRRPSSTTLRPPRLPSPPRDHHTARMAPPNRCGPFTLVRSMETTRSRGRRRRIDIEPPELSDRVASARQECARNFGLIKPKFRPPNRPRTTLNPWPRAATRQFRAAFRSIPALVAQGIEHWFPKPCAVVRVHSGAPDSR